MRGAAAFLGLCCGWELFMMLRVMQGLGRGHTGGGIGHTVRGVGLLGGLGARDDEVLAVVVEELHVASHEPMPGEC